MKVRKIDITEKLLDLPENHGSIYREAQYDPSQMRVMDIGSNPDFTTTVRENTYEIRQIFKKGYGPTSEKEFVAVKLDQNGLFGDLLQVADDIFSAKLAKAHEDGFWDGEHKGFQKGEKRMLEAFKALSWWKRLTNKF